jgi:hypothetical protein
MTEPPSTFETFGLSFPASDACSSFVGQTIEGRYTLRSRLGEGGFGCVFLADQKSPSRRVAVKVQKHAGRESHRMAKEADLLARLDDRGIARVFEAGTWESPTGPRFFVAMELIPGGLPLHVFCHDHRLAVHERLALFREVCRSVSVAHREGIVHRDLKPGNILVDKHGQPRIIDFGISKLVTSGWEQAAAPIPGEHDASPEETRVGTLIGTPRYAAPEQQDGAATTRSDVYALGIILRDDCFDDLDGKMPSWLRPLVARCIATDPQTRYADAAQLDAELERVLRRQAVRRWMMKWMAGAAASLLAVVAGMALVPPKASPEPTPELQALSLTPLDDWTTVAGDAQSTRAACTGRGDIAVSKPAMPTVTEFRLSPIRGGVRSLAFSGTNAILASSDPGGWRVWDAAMLSRSTWPILEVRAGESSPEHAGLIAVSPDGTTLFAQDGLRSVVAYQVPTAKRLGRFDFGTPDSSQRITAIAPAAASDVSFVGLSDGSVWQWVLRTGSTMPAGTPRGPGDIHLASNAPATRIAVGGGDGVVSILDGRTAAVVRTAKPFTGRVTALCFTTADQVVVAACLPEANDTAVIRLSSSGGTNLQVSGSMSVARPVTGLAFTGSEVVAVSPGGGSTAVNQRLEQRSTGMVMINRAPHRIGF